MPLDYTGVGAAQFDEPATLVWGTPIPVLPDTVLELTLRVARIAGLDANIAAGLVLYDDEGTHISTRLTMTASVNSADWTDLKGTFDDWPAAAVSALMVFQHQTAGSTIQVDEFSHEDVTAVLAANAAVLASSAANASATDAGQQAAAAQSERVLAETARAGAETAETNAATSETNAAGSEATASTAATNAATSENNAGDHATAAASSASLASTKADEAGQDATAANTAKLEAETARAGAETAETNAATSETNAAGSAATASTAATNAATSENNAGDHATAAASSASVATTKADEASQDATAANSAKLEAETARAGAETAETNAATSETNAAGSAATAGTAATNAATSENNAGDHATAAASSASLASTKADEAGQQATAATTAKVQAETASAASSVSETNAATSETNAAGYSASALSARDVTVTAANDTQAAVTQLAVVTADFNNTLSAGVMFKAQANNEVSLLELIAGDGSETSVSLAKIEATNILLSGSVGMTELSVGLGRNEIENSSFAKGIDNVALTTSGLAGSATVKLARINSYWDSVNPTLELYQSTGDSAGYADAALKVLAQQSGTYGQIPVAPDTWYEWSVASTQLRCEAQLRIEWYTAAGALISTSSGTNFERLEPSTNANTWSRDHIMAKAPANAAFALPVIRKYGTNTEGTSYLFALRPMFARTHAEATRPTPYEPSTSTFIDGEQLVTQSVTAEKMNVLSLRAITATIGHFKSSETGARIEIEDERITVYRADNTVAVRIGNLS